MATGASVTATTNEMAFANETVPTEISTTRLSILGITTSLSTVIGAYIFIALIIYECRVRNSKGHGSRRASRELYASMMRISAIAAALISTLTFSSQVFQIFLDLIEDIRFCDILIKTDFTLTSCHFISVYAMLWLRQRSFYVHASTRHLTSCYTRVMSVMVLIVLIAITFINPAVFDSTQWYARTNFGCKLQSSAFPAEFHWSALAVIATSFQLSLLALFVYPLVKHRAALKSRSEKSQTVNKKAEGFIQVIRRAFYLCLVCVVSDIIVVIVNVAVVTEIHFIPQIAADVNILINTICSIVTFVDWRERLFPCVEIYSTAAPQRKEASSSGIGTSSREKGISVERPTSDIAMDDKITITMEKELVV